jgi:hypothetical protein
VTGRGLHGRRLARLLLVGVLALDVVLALLVATAPTGMGGPFPSNPLAFSGWLIAALGITLHVGGLAWMVRIVHAEPDAHPSFWRSRRS